MAWLNREKAPVSRGRVQKTDTPEGLWERCTSCGEIILRKDFYANQNVCTKCDHHFYLPAPDRLQFFLDPESFKEEDADLYSGDPLKFSDQKSYKDRLQSTIKRLDRRDAIITGHGKLLTLHF